MLSKIITTVNWRLVKVIVDREASLSEVARKTRTTKANTFHALKGLEELDIVRKTVKGRTHIYRFNFLHPHARKIVGLIEDEKRANYNKKLDNIPTLLNSLLSSALKTDYHGCIFFGSSLENIGFKDIDVFILLREKRNTAEIERKIGLVDSRLSPLFGSMKELEVGIEKQDMLYKNILSGITFGPDVFPIKYREFSLKKEDIKERFIIGYREVLSCLEFPDQLYRKTHLEKGVMDFIYAVLNYFDLSPKNDREAAELFKRLEGPKPATVRSALKLMEKYSWIS